MNMTKLGAACSELGFDSIEQLLEEAAGDSVVHGICTNEDCTHMEDVEPDCQDGPGYLPGQAGPTESEEHCDEIKKTDPLRAAVAWRWYQGGGEKRGIFSAVSGIPLTNLARFVESGEIDAGQRDILEGLR